MCVKENLISYRIIVYSIIKRKESKKRMVQEPNRDRVTDIAIVMIELVQVAHIGAYRVSLF